MPGEVARKPGSRVVSWDKFPAELRQIIAPEKWAQSILTGAAYGEPDPDFITRMLAAESIFADTADEAFAAANIHKAQEWVRDREGESSGPFEITQLYVAKSDFQDGNPTYVIVECVMLGSGETVRWHTGATQVQATLIGLLRNGVWPIRAQLKRGDQTDRADRHMLFLFPPD